MKGYYIRFFSLAPLTSTARLQVWLAERQYGVRPLGKNHFEVFTDPDLAYLDVALNTAREELLRNEIRAFMEAIARLPYPTAGYVLGRLARSNAVVALQGWELVEGQLVSETLSGCYALSDGMVQVDGEGFYEQGALILSTE